ncbi:MAG: hypothetical protein AB1938_15920 [Myxococcota bacterium]
MARWLLLVALVPLLARAGWGELPALMGAPQDVVVANDGGVVIGASSSQAVAWSVSDAGATPVAQLSGSYFGAGLFGGACLAGLRAGGVDVSAGCGAGAAVSGTPRRFRVFPSGLSAARVTIVSSDGFFVAPSPTGTFTQPLQTPWTSTGARSLQHATIDGLEVALMNASTLDLRVSIDGGSIFTVPLSAPARDAAPFDRGGVGAIVVTTAGAAVLLPALGMAEVPITLPGGFTAQFVTMTTERGSAQGAGYGLMSSASGQVLSPVPDPSQPGSIWIPRSGAPLLWDRVHCLDAYRCAAIGDGGVLHVLTNDFAPVVALDAGPVFAGASAQLVATATDSDGDPVFITWAAGLGTVTPGGDPEGRSAALLVPPGAECANASVPMTLTISDGLGLHNRTLSTSVRLDSAAGVSLSPLAPVVTPGTPSVVFTGSTDAGCAGATLQWSTTDGQMGTGNTFTWTVPAAACGADGGTVTVTASYQDPAGHLASASTIVTLPSVAPPSAPVFVMPATQPAGTTQLWSPIDGGHVCDGVSGFPGLTLDWMLPTPPPGVTLTALDGGLEIAVPDFCTRATVTATAQLRVVGEPPARASPPGTLTVDIVPNPPPLGPTTPFAINLEVDAGVAMGFFTVDAGCRDPALLAAVVSVGIPDASVVAQQTFTQVPGPWSLPIPPSCGAGQYELLAELLDDGGVTGARVREVVPASTLPILPGIASPATLPVTCGVGGRGQLTVASNPNGCATPLATWRQIGGPALLQSTLVGATVDVQTASMGLEVVGQRLQFDVEVGDGTGLTATGSHEVLLTATPFVELSESLSPFPAREEEAQFVTLRLRNASSCAVDGLTLRETLVGLTPVLTTIRGGGAVTPEWADGTLTLQNVSLAAGATETISFKAVRRLLTRVELDGSVLLNDQLVSYRPQTPAPVTGCGCQSGVNPLLGLALAWLTLRRRGGLRQGRPFV